MTDLEHRRQHGWQRLAGRRAARLDRLTLGADDAMIAEVRRRLARAGWYSRPDEPDRLLAATTEAAKARQEAANARASATAALAQARTATEQAEAEAGRVAHLAAELATVRTEAATHADAAARAAQAARLAEQERQAALARAAEQAQAARQTISDAHLMAQHAQQAGQRLTEAQRLAQDAIEARKAAEDTARLATAETETLRWQLSQAQHQLAGIRAELSARDSAPTVRKLAAVSAASMPLPPGVVVPDVDGVAADKARTVVAARSAHPDATQAELAEITGVSVRTIRRVLAAANAASTRPLPATA
jgi:chemosensory pili system protein ChpA (sensor histidine kinase/response regulator)